MWWILLIVLLIVVLLLISIKLNINGGGVDDPPIFNQESLEQLLKNGKLFDYHNAMSDQDFTSIYADRSYIPEKNEEPYKTITYEGQLIKYRIHPEDNVKYNKERVNDDELLKKFFSLLDFEHYNVKSTPVISLRYVFSTGIKTRITDPRKLVTRSHLPLLKAIKKFIVEELFHKTFQNYPKDARFFPYVDVGDYEKYEEFYVYAEYVPTIGQCGTRTYELYDRMSLSEFIYIIEEYGIMDVEFPEFVATKLKRKVQSNKGFPIKDILHTTSEINEILKSHNIVLTCDLKIGPSISAVLASKTSDKFYFIEFKYYQNNIYNTLVDGRKRHVEKYCLTTFYEITKTNMPPLRVIFRPSVYRTYNKEQLDENKSDKTIVEYARDMINIVNNKYKRIGGGISVISGDPFYIYENDPVHTYFIKKDKLGLIYTKSNAAKLVELSKTDNIPVMIGKNVPIEKFDVIKYNLWTIPISVIENPEMVLKKPNMIYNYSREELYELISLSDKAIEEINELTGNKNKYIVCQSIPPPLGHESVHFKYDSSKSVAYDGNAINFHISGSKFKVRFYEKERALILAYDNYYSDNWCFDCFTWIN